MNTIKKITYCLFFVLLINTSLEISVLAQRKQSKVREQSVLELKSVFGDWKHVRDITIGGRLFDSAASMGENIYNNSTIVTLPNREGFVTFNAWVGISDGNHKACAQFVVSADGDEVYSSPKFQGDDPPLRISVSIKGRRAITLRILQYNRVGGYCAMWADPVFTMSPTEKTKNSNSTSTEGDNSSPAGNVIELVGSKILRLEPDNLKELISDLKLSIAEDPDYSKNKPTLAIAAFKLISRTGEELSPSNADNIREDLSTGLIKSKSFDIVERGQLEKALTELKIGLKDTFDSTTAQKLGRLVNARTVLIGSISDRGTFIVINVRLIDTQTGKSHIASQTKIQQ